MRKLLQGHLDQRSPGEAAGPVEGADGVDRSQRRVHERHLEKKSRTPLRWRVPSRQAPNRRFAMAAGFLQALSINWFLPNSIGPTGRP